MAEVMKEQISRIVKLALEEDIGSGDITTNATVPEGHVSTAVVRAKEECVVCGLNVAEEVFRQLDGDVKFTKLRKDGETAGKGEAIAEISGRTRAILTGERTALNFLQRMSGIATKTKNMLHLIEGTNAKLLDTRKTTPGLRVLEKYAVVCGGGTNHRMGLYDQVLIKDNHISVAGIRRAVELTRKTGKRVEIEVKTSDQISEALEAGADIIMLDNMPLDDIKKSIKMIGSKAIVEVSGGVSEKTIRDIAEAGADWISVGALTHSVRSVDISIDMKAS